MIIVIIALFSLSCKADEEPNLSQVANAPHSPESQALVPHIETARVSPVRPVLTLNGRLAYTDNGYSRISSPVKGRVVEMGARLGDRVQAGDVLLVVDSPDIAEAYANFIREDSELKFSKQSYELAHDLYEHKALSMKEFKQAENDLVKAKAEYRRAKALLVSLRISAAELDKPISEQHITSRFELRSPLTGTVVDRSVTPGQSVDGSSQILFTVADLESLQVVADVYERDLSALRIGQEGTLTVEAYPNLTFVATVTAIGDVVDLNTRTIKVRARTDNREGKLKPEMFAKLRVDLSHGLPLVAVPKESVIMIKGQEYVYVEESAGKFTRRAIRVGSRSEDVFHVLEGLAGSERVVTKGLIFLEREAGKG